MGTECERRGCDVNNELWSTKVLLEQPQIILDVHQSYLLQGADLIGTDTYQMSPETCTKYFQQKQQEENDNNQEGVATKIDSLTVHQICNLAIDVAQQAISTLPSGGERITSPKILGCVGSIGSSLPDAKEFTGDYPEECLTDAYMETAHTERLNALVTNTSVNALLIETMPRLDEVLFVVKLLETKIFPSAQRAIPVFVSFSGKAQGLKITSGFGDEVQNAFSQLAKSPSVCAVGVNCCSPQVADDAFAFYIEAFESYFVAQQQQQETSAVPPPAVICYANSGEIFNGQDGTWAAPTNKDDDKLLGENFSSLGEWFKQSKMMKVLEKTQFTIPIIVGGCCRTTPDRDIQSLRKVINEL